MICKNCGAEFEKNFCPICGTKGSSPCYKCGTEYIGNFCPQCGARRNRICRKCGVEYAGSFCPNCGTKATKQRKLLGFRSNRLWKKVISSMYLGFIGIVSFAGLIISSSPDDFITWIQIVLFFGAPYIFLSDFKFRNVLPLVKRHEVGSSILGMWCVYLLIAIFCIATNPAESCDHSWIETERMEASCTKDGKIKLHCELCNANDIEYIDKKGHVYVTQEDTPEKLVQVCSICGDTETEKKAATADEKNSSKDEKPENFESTTTEEKTIVEDNNSEKSEPQWWNGIISEQMATDIKNAFIEIDENPDDITKIELSEERETDIFIRREYDLWTKKSGVFTVYTYEYYEGEPEYEEHPEEYVESIGVLGAYPGGGILWSIFEQ